MTRTFTPMGVSIRRLSGAMLTVAMAAAVLLVVPAPARAHGGITPQPIVTGVPGGLDGLEASGLVAYSPRIRVTNPDSDPLTVVDESGRPWLRISADGVFADLTVRQWYESLDASGRGVDPEPDAPEGWTRVSTLPTWEWFDTVLLPRSGEEEHDWSIPVVVDGDFAEITGVLQESDLEGRWVTDLDGDGQLGPARLTAVSGPVPVFVVQLLEAEEIVVVGREGEPLLRLTEAGFEVNRASPSWNDHARLDPNNPVGDVVESADGEPVWEMQLEGAPTATWLDTRLASPDVVPASRSETEIVDAVPILVDGEQFDVAATTRWVGDEVPLIRMTLPTLIAASLGAGLLAAGAVRLWERRREGAADDQAPADDQLPDATPPDATQADGVAAPETT